jgi:hypothetical protein
MWIPRIETDDDSLQTWLRGVFVMGGAGLKDLC